MRTFKIYSPYICITYIKYTHICWIEPGSPASQADVLPSEPPGKPPIIVVSFKSFLHILLVCSLHILNTNISLLMWFVNIFLSACSLSFYFINVIFSGTKGFILVNLSLFFKDHAFGFISNNSLPKYGHK